MQIDDVARLAAGLAGVRCATRQGLAEWRYHGRLVARQVDDVHLVIRAEFDYRDALLRQFPGTFSVPARYRKHMMVVADLASGDAGAIEDALEAAWQLQRSADLRRDGGEVPADDLWQPGEVGVDARRRLAGGDRQAGGVQREVPPDRTAAIFDLAPGGHVGRRPPGTAPARPAAQTACSSSPP